ncbi:hypothetical protein N7495_007400 [Penicillium taxi]|uniref:uncharacterized protein n=1 Tax=Penicillium taxi TaxID=168475 RepID=UPI0025452EFA|nr:uncharacterized protein N7495_007400 [Penicillium taxi]KAJ5887359.1 hypothetical protein N7495_007400 [Penicillium taxi]
MRQTEKTTPRQNKTGGKKTGRRPINMASSPGPLSKQFSTLLHWIDLPRTKAVHTKSSEVTQMSLQYTLDGSLHSPRVRAHQPDHESRLAPNLLSLTMGMQGKPPLSPTQLETVLEHQMLRPARST